MRRDHALDGVEGFFCAAFLNVTDRGVYQDDTQNNYRVDAVTEKRSDDRRAQKYVNQEVMKLRKKRSNAPRGFAAGSRFNP
jgi:hypothetical protein